MSTLDEITSYLDREEALSAFIKFASKNKVPVNSKEINTSREILQTQLYAYIARNILDNEGFYPAIEKIDNTLIKAIELLSTGPLIYAEQ